MVGTITPGTIMACIGAPRFPSEADEALEWDPLAVTGRSMAASFVCGAKLGSESSRDLLDDDMCGSYLEDMAK